MFASLQNRLKIEEATSSKEDVTPVYLLEEIWELVRSSPSDSVAALVDHTRKRLGNRSAVVKQKTLRLIKYICAKGSSEFKRSMSKQASPIRELTHYKGEPDPFKGDVPNQRVRDLAKEALDAVFAPTDLNPSTAQAPLQSRIQGFGGGNSDSASSLASVSGRGGGSAGAAPRMTGFGNPRFEGAGGASSGGVAGSGLDVSSPKALLASIGGMAGGLSSTGRQGLMRDRDYNGGSGRSSPTGFQQRAPSGVGAASSSASRLSTTANDGNEEARLVDGLCAPGGLRAQPAREDLRLFVESIGNLDGARVAQLLQAKMEDPSWQVALRALYAVEAVVAQGATAACGEVAVHFQADPAPVRRAAESPQASVRQRALALLRALGADGAASASAAPGGAKTGPVVADLMGGMDEPDVAAAAAAPASAQDFLGDLLDPTPAQPPAASTSSGDADMFGGLSVGPSPSANGNSSSNATAGAAAADLFGGLSLSSSVAPAPHQGAASGTGGVDLLGGLSGSSSSHAAGPTGNGSSAGGDLFGGLAVGGGSSKPASAKAGPAAGLSLDAGLFGAGPSALQSPAQPMQARGSQAAGTDIFGAATSPGMITLASPEKPSAQQQFYQPQQAGYGSYPGGMQQQYGMYAGYPQQQQQMQQQYSPAQYAQMQQQYQMQQMQYMQQMQMQQQMGPAGYGGFQPQQQQPSLGSLSNGSAYSHGPDLGGGHPTASAALKSQSSGLTTEASFDFVGDHISKLRSAK